MTFKSYDDSWIQQDLPWDAEVLEVLKQNWQGVWDDCVPAVSYHNPLFASFDEQCVRRYSSTKALCVFCRPILLLPGMSKIHLHVACRVGGVEASATDYAGTLFASQGPVSYSQPQGLGLSPTGDDFIEVTESTSYGVHTVTIDYGLEVERPRLTLLQLWWRSTSDHSADAISGGSTAGIPVSPEGKRNVLADNVTTMYTSSAAANEEEATHYEYQVVDSTPAVLASYNIFHYGNASYDGGSGVSDNSLSSFYLTEPVDKSQPGVDDVRISPIAFLELLSVGVSFERDSDAIYLPEDAVKAPDKFARPSIMDAFVSGATSVLTRRRPVSLGPFPMQGDEPSISYTVDGAWTTPLLQRKDQSFYEQSFCFIPVYEHAKLHFAAVLLGWEGIERFCLRVAIQKANASAAHSYVVFEDITIDPPTRDDVPGILRYWHQPSGFAQRKRATTVEGAFYPEDVDRLLGEVAGTRLVGGTLNIPTPDDYGTGDPEPLLVRIQVAPTVRFDYGNESGTFVEGEVLSFATGSDEALLISLQDNGTSGRMTCMPLSWDFDLTNNEQITGQDSGAKAEVNLTESYSAFRQHTLGMLPFFWTEES